MPWEVLARAAGDEGYLSVVDIVGRSDIEESPRATRPIRPIGCTKRALSVGGCGAEAAWQFPCGSRDLILSRDQVVEGWDRFHNGRGAGGPGGLSARKIRLWRPEVVVTATADAHGDDAAQAVLSKAVSDAVARAANPQAFASQIALAGLEPWRVKRAYGRCRRGAAAESRC